ncbi:HTTM domain-containing protein [Paracoccus spongiarum]|uniref:HTTM domain-containing protein n=1 Tax=Paracoccus spongiarum TaxID=3064387 RepID=A0ABT9JCU8_9RHOB|nr:HTTM domain-containing protein [Paracoccus sp. 2205BS29-5]MDP5307440.1 HTTM domain-containing protein [Paracoccus sp. 2205BS29-5]
MRFGAIAASLAGRASATLSQPVSGVSLAMVRIALGALLAWDCWRFIRHDRVFRYWVEPDFHFAYGGFGWVTPLPPPWIHAAWLAMGLAAILVMLGLFYRVAIVVLTLLFGYFFLLDKAEYLNHFYLVILLLMLMCVLPAHRTLSLDARFRPALRGAQVPYAAVFILRAQMEIMLVFAGLAKLTPDWLAGEPLGLWLRDRAGGFPLGFLFQHDAAIIAAAWGTTALHLIGATLLLWRRSRLAIFAVYYVFHAANAILFNIGIFPWLTIAATTIFFSPDWPRRAARRLMAWFRPVPPHQPPPPAAPRRLPAVALLAMAAWIAVQLALPLRAAIFASDLRWSGEGHRFSWRMRLHDRQADGVFVVTSDEQEWTVRPTDYLTARQAGKMLVRPDMIHQFAGHLEAVWRDAGHGDVAVRAAIRKSLNGRPAQAFVDPTVDLTAIARSPLAGDPWILPLRHPVWGVVDNRALRSPVGIRP